MWNARGEKYPVYVATIKKHLNKKTAQDLLEELQREFDAAEAKGTVIDPDLYYAYMDVIEELEPLPDDPIDPAALFRQVQDAHPDLFADSETRTETVHRARPKFRGRRAVMVAAVACGLAILLGAAAYGGKTLTGFQSLGGDRFQVRQEPSGQMELEVPGENGYHSLAEALEAYGISGVAPTWIPEDYSLVVVEVVELKLYVNIAAGYSNGENDLVIRIVEYRDGKIPDSDYERREDLDEVYRVHSTDHFLMMNKERLQATWESGNCLCNIMTSISKEQVKQMIDSIYKGE